MPAAGSAANWALATFLLEHGAKPAPVDLLRRHDDHLHGERPVEDLLGEKVSRTRVGVRDLHAASRALEAAGYAVTRNSDHLEVEGHDHPEQVTRLLAEKGIFVNELSAVRPTLESFFLQLTGREHPGDTEADEEAS